MKISLLLVLASPLLLAACSKQNASVVQETNQSASGNPITAPVDYLGAVAKAKRVAEKTIDTTSLQRAVQLFYAQEDRFPNDLNELVTKRYLPSLPPAPAGTQWLYNPKNGSLKAVKQQ